MRDGLVLVSEQGYGDEFDIGSDELFTVLDVAEMFGGLIEMLLERKSNRMTTDILSKKTKVLGWETKRSLTDYINVLKTTDWENK
ncbi:hypothetical protein [Vibrio cholerae]|uniref:hypothetical protein n=1 Tax=Vibrio cholerae TaxID=666 RepID=UPI001A9CFDBA|nr:hypothetical protein [Vibrio cholerae]MBO1366896.1 hypothetical protein [Vibrio cholerae]MBO1370068.1 hypothetical protein [Vibrio cholerae]MBO1373027.1 hypothetical protein [Vibrio cholerae]MBO1377414.1 hypothetical protein [Vibrio cholerae]MBO1406808.1 hypothetical protein [Vibrio cholerae]